MVGLLGLTPERVAAEPPPETTRIRLTQMVSTCQAPLYLSDALLRTEGFTDVQWVRHRLAFSQRAQEGVEGVALLTLREQWVRWELWERWDIDQAIGRAVGDVVT